MENHNFFNGKTHYKWSFSIAMLVYQRVPSHKNTATDCHGLLPFLIIFRPSASVFKKIHPGIHSETWWNISAPALSGEVPICYTRHLPIRPRGNTPPPALEGHPPTSRGAAPRQGFFVCQTPCPGCCLDVPSGKRLHNYGRIHHF